MSTEENKVIARRAVEAINAGDFSLLESLIMPNGVDHAVPPTMPSTRESAIQFLTMPTSRWGSRMSLLSKC